MIERLLHGVTDIDEGTDARVRRLVADVLEDSANLGVPTLARDPRHQRGQAAGIGHET